MRNIYSYLLFSVVLCMVFSSCETKQLVIARYIKECNEVNTKLTSRVDHYDLDTISSKIADISYFIHTDNTITATLYMENGHISVISVANGLLNDANLVGRTITWIEQVPIYKKDTIFFDTVFVTNLVCEEKIFEIEQYFVKVYDYITNRRYKLAIDKATFYALNKAPAFVRITDEKGNIIKRANTNQCIPWEFAQKFKEYNQMRISISPHTNSLKVLESKKVIF